MGGIERNVISQIPITHFQNYVESQLDDVFKIKSFAANYHSTQFVNDPATSEPHRINHYFTGFTNQEHSRDLEHIKSLSQPHINQGMKNRAVLYNAEINLLSFYRNKEAYNKAFLNYVKEVRYQFEKGVEDQKG